MNPFHRHRQPTLQRGIAVAYRRLCPVPLNGQLSIMDLLTNGRSMWLTVMSLHVPDPGAVGQRRARDHDHRAIPQVDDLHRVGGKAVGTRGPGQGVQVGDAVRARQALGWSDQH